MLRLAHLSIRRPALALVAWALVAGTLALVGLGVSHGLSPSVTVVPGSQSARAERLARGAFGPSVLVPILLEGPAAQLDRQGPRLVAALARRPDTRVMSAWSGGATGASLRPRRGAAMIVAAVARSERRMVSTVQPQIDRLVAREVSGPVRAHVSGQPTLDRALRDEALASTRRAALIAVGALLLVLLAGLRAPVAALLLAGLGAVTTLSGFGTMALLGKAIDVDPVAVALASLIGLATGVGFALPMLDRFHQASHLGRREAAAAAAAAVRTTGRAVLVSGTALALSLVLATAIVPTRILASVGIGVLLCALLATGTAVVVLPAALVLLGRRIDWLTFPAPRPLARGWGWLTARGRWVMRRAVVAGALATAALVALALPASGLRTGPPDITTLPASSVARQSFERIGTVMGPGWATPFNVVVVSRSRPVTAPPLLRELLRYQGRLARDPRVESVVGPGAFAATARDLKALPNGLEDSAKLLKGGRRDLGRLQRGLGQAGRGARELRAGLGSAAAGAGQLRSGSGAAGGGATQLRTGLDQARGGATAISGGLRDALAGANALARGSADALAGARALAAGIGSAAGPVSQGLPVFRSLADDVAGASQSVTAASGAAASASGQIGAALNALQGMTAGKADPAYAGAVDALSAAQSSAAGVASTLAGVQAKLAGDAAVSSAAAQQVADLSAGLNKLYTGSTQLQGGIAQLRRGNAALAGGIARLSAGGGQLTGGLGQLRDGAAALEAGLGQLTTGAGSLESGLSGGVAPSGKLAGGLGRLEAGVAKFRGSLPSTKDLERLKRQSPGLFDSGYFVLAAIQGAGPADRAVASFAVNLDRGGTAGQIVVVPRRAAGAQGTRELGADLQRSAAGLARATHTEVAVGGPAGDLGDFTSVTRDRLPLVLAVLALAGGLVLAIALRAVALPVAAVLLDLLAAAATFGALWLLFGGHDPRLGGPGWLDPMSIAGIFATVFGLSLTFEVLLLVRAREHFLQSGDPAGALWAGLRRTAAQATGAALLMVAAALPFAFAGVGGVRQFGAGVAIAAALSAAIVRPVLLPAAATLLGRRGWWPTGRILRPHGRLRVLRTLRRRATDGGRPHPA